MLGAQNGQIICTCCGSDFKSKPAFVYHVVNCLPPELLANDEVRQGLGLSQEVPSQTDLAVLNG